jgi:protein-S-isoprenylcysteine O-methyltransferase Ste14
MTTFNTIIGACWIAFFVVWFAFALRRNTGRSSRSPAAIGTRLVLAVALILGALLGQRLPMLAFGRFTTEVASLGCALCFAGLAFAVWARATLGRSWGMPMTLHQKPELVTRGPYRLVRHPIYTGMSAMVIGTALVYPGLLLWAAFLIAYMIVSARREERDMELLFPDTYPAYKQRSKMLVPFVV